MGGFGIRHNALVSFFLCRVYPHLLGALQDCTQAKRWRKERKKEEEERRGGGGGGTGRWKDTEKELEAMMQALKQADRGFV